MEHYFIVRETHKEPGIEPYHLHAYVKLKIPTKSRKNDILDLNGHHPNI